MKYNLKLRHTKEFAHFEFWVVNGDKVEVTSVTPSNYPKHTEGVFTKQEALRNLALMTSKQEGWVIADNDDVWHKFVEEPEPKAIVRVAWSKEAGAIFIQGGWEALEEADNNGVEDLVYDEILFNTHGEAFAFTRGINDANGWDDPTTEIKE